MHQSQEWHSASLFSPCFPSFLPLNRLQLSFYNYFQITTHSLYQAGRLVTRSSNSTRLFHAKSDLNYLVQVSVWSYIVSCLNFVKNLQNRMTSIICHKVIRTSLSSRILHCDCGRIGNGYDPHFWEFRVTNCLLYLCLPLFPVPLSAYYDSCTQVSLH
jgi:hypothetical protein